MRRVVSGVLAAGWLLAWGLAGVGTGAAATPPRGHVALGVDGRVISTALTPAQALADLKMFLLFKPRLPGHVPAGMTLQSVNVTTFGGSPAYSAVSFDYAGPGQRAFSLREGKLHLSTSVSGGTVTAMAVGKAPGQLTEVRKGKVAVLLALSWFAGIGYDLHTLGTATRLTAKDLLTIARAV